MKSTLSLLLLIVVAGRLFSQKDTFVLKKKLAVDTQALHYTIPVFNTSGADTESELGEQDISSLLQASRDVYTQFASFQFGAARFRIRGYAAKNQMVMINGVPLNQPETGFSSWSSWGGLNDVTRSTETRFGNFACRYGFSGIGGYTNIDSRASSFKKGTRVSYGTANRIFRNRIMFTHSTGLNKKGWAFALSGSARWGNGVYIPGTFFDAKSLYFSVDKKIKEKHLFSLTGFIATLEKGLTTAATLETYELSSSPYYNSAWGYQNGKVRNASVSRTNCPVLLLSHQYTPTQNKRLQITLHSTFGKSSLSGLNFNNAANPKPDYYKYLPSYFYSQGNQDGAEAQKLLWQNDVNTRQVNWDELIAANQANLYSESNDGSQINSEETRARYIVEKRVDNILQLGLHVLYNERKGNLFVSTGANAFLYRSKKHKEMDDLLGASFWIDVDQFAENLGTDGMVEQNDISRPNRKIYTGDRFGYDYMIDIQRAEAWGMAEYNFHKTDLYVGLNISNTRLWRNGNIANGKFPENSKGKSSTSNFLNYGFKAGGTFKINGRNFISANLHILSRAPEAGNIFISPRVRNDIVDDVRSEEIFSSDINYEAKYPGCKFRLTFYSTQINNQTWVRTYYDDVYNTLINMVMTGLNQKHRGFELALEKTVYHSHILQLVSGFAQAYYTSQPKLQAWQDNNSTSLYYNRKVYLKNYRLGTSPQWVSGIGYRYMGKKYWSASLCLNYFDFIYVEANPNRRTAEVAGKFQTDEKHLAESITAQERLPAYFMLNAHVYKSLRVSKKNYIGCSLSVNNLLNTTSSISGGFEQLRWDAQHPERFANKYAYAHGITYMLLIWGIKLKVHIQ